MDSVTHTPGPWTRDSEHDDPNGNSGVSTCVIHGAGKRIAYTWFHADRFEHSVSRDQAEANASLIAAAPDLLVALKDAAPLLDVALGAVMAWETGNARSEAIDEIRRTIRDAKAAIAKAQGSASCAAAAAGMGVRCG